MEAHGDDLTTATSEDHPSDPENCGSSVCQAINAAGEWVDRIFSECDLDEGKGKSMSRSKHAQARIIGLFAVVDFVPVKTQAFHKDQLCLGRSRCEDQSEPLRASKFQ
jgi:hypothetical protein